MALWIFDWNRICGLSESVFFIIFFFFEYSFQRRKKKFPTKLEFKTMGDGCVPSAYAAENEAMIQTRGHSESFRNGHKTYFCSHSTDLVTHKQAASLAVARNSLNVSSSRDCVADKSHGKWIMREPHPLIRIWSMLCLSLDGYLRPLRFAFPPYRPQPTASSLEAKMKMSECHSPEMKRNKKRLIFMEID